jgi:predicted DsbA family dithiol-disulfide isomerase
VKWIAFPLHPETPAEGRSLKDLFAGRPIDVPEMVAHLQRVATELGLPFGDRTMTYNSRLAQELAKWAADKGREKAFHRAVFRAYFADGLNIGDPDLLVNLASDAGLQGHEARRVIDDRAYRRAVDRDFHYSLQMGVRAVPTFMVNGAKLVGAQPTAVLGKFIAENGGKKKT